MRIKQSNGFVSTKWKIITIIIVSGPILVGRQIGRYCHHVEILSNKVGNALRINHDFQAFKNACLFSYYYYYIFIISLWKCISTTTSGPPTFYLLTLISKWKFLNFNFRICRGNVILLQLLLSLFVIIWPKLNVHVGWLKKKKNLLKPRSPASSVSLHTRRRQHRGAGLLLVPQSKGLWVFFFATCRRNAYA